MTKQSCDAALDTVIVALWHREPRRFHISVVGYYIEGRPYLADGLAMDPQTTPDVVLTDDGFACHAFFPATHLDALLVEAKGVARSEDSVDLVSVTVEIKSRDIWAIAEFVDGVQEDLFLDADAFLGRKRAFAREADAWRVGRH